MNAGRVTRAEQTAAIVSSAVETGASLSIPGTRDVRPGRAAGRPSGAIERTESREQHAIAPADRQRLEYAREGGGAPSERRVGTPAGWFGRMWRLFKGAA